MLDEGVESRSDGVPSDPLDTNRFRWKSTFSIRACVMNGGSDIGPPFVLLSNLVI